MPLQEHKFKSVKRGSTKKLLKLANFAGGYPNVRLDNMSWRGHADPLSDEIGGLLVTDRETTLATIAQVMADAPERPDATKLVLDPFAIPLNRPSIPSAACSASLQSTFHSITRNEDLRAVFESINPQLIENVAEVMVNSMPCHPRVFHEILDRSLSGAAGRVVKRFVKTATFAKLARSSGVDYMTKRFQADVTLRKHIERTIDRIDYDVAVQLDYATKITEGMRSLWKIPGLTGTTLMTPFDCTVSRNPGAHYVAARYLDDKSRHARLYTGVKTMQQRVKSRYEVEAIGSSVSDVKRLMLLRSQIRPTGPIKDLLDGAVMSRCGMRPEQIEHAFDVVKGGTAAHRMDVMTAIDFGPSCSVNSMMRVGISTDGMNIKEDKPIAVQSLMLYAAAVAIHRQETVFLEIPMDVVTNVIDDIMVCNVTSKGAWSAGTSIKCIGFELSIVEREGSIATARCTQTGWTPRRAWLARILDVMLRPGSIARELSVALKSSEALDRMECEGSTAAAFVEGAADAITVAVELVIARFGWSRDGAGVDMVLSKATGSVAAMISAHVAGSPKLANTFASIDVFVGAGPGGHTTFGMHLGDLLADKVRSRMEARKSIDVVLPSNGLASEALAREAAHLQLHVKRGLKYAGSMTRHFRNRVRKGEIDADRAVLLGPVLVLEGTGREVTRPLRSMIVGDHAMGRAIDHDVSLYDITTKVSFVSVSKAELGLAKPPTLMDIARRKAATVSASGSRVRDRWDPIIGLRVGERVVVVGCGQGEIAGLCLDAGAVVTGVDTHDAFPTSIEGFVPPGVAKSCNFRRFSWSDETIRDGATWQECGRDVIERVNPTCVIITIESGGGSTPDELLPLLQTGYSSRVIWRILDTSSAIAGLLSEDLRFHDGSSSYTDIIVECDKAAVTTLTRSRICNLRNTGRVKAPTKASKVKTLLRLVVPRPWPRLATVEDTRDRIAEMVARAVGGTRSGMERSVYEKGKEVVEMLTQLLDGDLEVVDMRSALCVALME
jgi:hypothetical protein